LLDEDFLPNNFRLKYPHLTKIHFPNLFDFIHHFRISLFIERLIVFNFSELLMIEIHYYYLKLETFLAQCYRWVS